MVAFEENGGKFRRDAPAQEGGHTGVAMSNDESNPQHGGAFVTALSLRLLGPFRAADRDGAALQLPKKAQALLCYLIANRERVVSRDEAAMLLWSNTDSVQARHSLRQCVSILRKLLPLEASLHLQSDKQALHLSKNHRFDIDLVAFEQASRSNDLEDLALADALYRGDLLLGISLEHEPFADWLTQERQRLSLARLKVIERLARLHAQKNDLPAAIDFARRLLAIDRYREESARLLMQLLAVSDQRGLALVEHVRIERLLRDDLGVLPDPTTRALAERIKRGATPEALTSPANSSQGGQFERARATHSLSLSHSPFLRIRLRTIVFPFENLTGRRRYDDAAHALTQDVATALAADRSLDVSLADASNAMKLRPRSPSNPAEPAYAISGTMRSHCGRVRIVVQLTSQSRLLWSGRFEDAAEPVLPIQDRVWSQIAARVSHAVRSSEVDRTRLEPAKRLSAYQLCLRAAASMRDGKAGNAAALELVRQLLASDPEFGIAHAVAARCFHVQRMMGWLSPDDQKLAEGVQHADAAIALSPDDPEALWLAGLAIMNIDGDLVRGRTLLDESLAINPHSPNAWIAGSFIHCHLGNAAAAMSHFREAERLNPFDSSYHVQQNAAATASFIAGDYAAAGAASEACLALRPRYTAALRIKVATLGLLGRADEAELAARELLALEPGASISRMRDYWNSLAPNAPHALDAKIDGWRRAGMPA
jgi:DNA-binding SARP family transcriptional activator